MDPAQPTLGGSIVALIPLQAEHGPALLRAAQDGQLWQST